MVTSVDEALAGANRVGYPVLLRPSYVLGGRAMVIAYDDEAVLRYMGTAIEYSQERPVLIDHFLEDAVECDVDALCDGTDVVDRGDHAAHRGGGHPLRRLVVRAAGGGPDGRCAAHHPRAHAQAGDGVERGWAGEHSVCHPARQGLCDRGEPARLAHGAVCVEGSRRAAGQDRIAADGGAHVEGAAAGCSGAAATTSTPERTSM